MYLNLSVNGRWQKTGMLYFPLLFRISRPYPIMLQTQLPINDVMDSPVLLFRLLNRSMQL